MSIVTASRSSRSAGPWACRRPPTTGARTGEWSARAVEDERLLELIRETHKANYFAYGYRRMWKALRRLGENVPRCRVQRLMAEHGIQGAKRRGKPWRTTKADPRALRSPDLVKRDFTAERPNALWVCDFTYLRCWEGVLYFSFVIDVFSPDGRRLAAGLPTCARRWCSTRCGWRSGSASPAPTSRSWHHSDAGSQYTSADYTQTLDDHLVLSSIGTVGDALDNALAESFVDSYKTELISDRVWRSRAQLELATVEWVAWFNHDRLHESLGDIPPVEFEQLHHARQGPISGNGSVVALLPRPADGLRPRRISTVGVDLTADRSLATEIAPTALTASDIDRARTASSPVEVRTAPAGLCALRFREDRSNRK